MTLLQLTNAYRALANGGRVAPVHTRRADAGGPVQLANPRFIFPRRNLSLLFPDVGPDFVNL